MGVVKDVRSGGFTGEVPPTMYFPHSQSGRSAYFVPEVMTLVVRTSGDPSALTGVVRGIVRDLEPNAPVSRVQTIGAIASAYALRAVFFEVKAWDPLTLAGTVLILMLAALLGSLIPAMRASAVHPMSALRVD